MTRRCFLRFFLYAFGLYKGSLGCKGLVNTLEWREMKKRQRYANNVQPIQDVLRAFLQLSLACCVEDCGHRLQIVLHQT